MHFYIWEPLLRGTDWGGREETLITMAVPQGSREEGANYNSGWQGGWRSCDVGRTIGEQPLKPFGTGWGCREGIEGKTDGHGWQGGFIKSLLGAGSSAKCFTHKWSQLAFPIRAQRSGSLQVLLKVTTVSRGQGGNWISSDDTESECCQLPFLLS